MENMNETITMSRIAFERMQAKDEHNDIWRNIIIILLIILLVASNIAWLIVWNSYDYSSEVVTVDTDDGGDANYIGNDGNIYNGESELDPEA
jgi:hypothetical protein